MTAPDDDAAAESPPGVPWLRAFRSRWILVSLAALLYWSASHSLRPFVVLRLDALGASAQEIGLVAAGYAFLALFAAVPGGRAIDRLGSNRVLYGSLVAMATLGVGYAFAGTITALLALQMVNGVVELGVWLSIQTLVTHAGKGGSLAKQLSVFSFAWGLGIAVGPTAGGLVFDEVGFVGLALTYSGLAIALIAVMLCAPSIAGEGSGRGGRLGRDALEIATQPAIRSVLLASFMAMYVISIRNTFYPLALADRGVSASVIGAMLSVMGIASLAVRAALPLLLQRLGAPSVLLLGTSIGVVGISLTPWLLHPMLLFVGAALTGAGYGSNPPVAMQLLGEHSLPSNRGLVMGLRAATSRLAQVVQPVAFGSMVAVTGMAWAFPLSGVVLVGIGLVTRRDLRALRETDEQPG